MGSIGVAFKRFLANKNTISIIGIVFAIIVIYLAYNWRVQTAVDPIEIPIATENLRGGTEILDNMVRMVRINRGAVNASGTIIRQRNQVIGQFVSETTNIPAGSFFYRGQLVNQPERPELILNLNPGYALFYLPVDLPSTYGNSIMPGDIIDVFLSADRGAHEPMLFGMFISNIRVLAVLDSHQRDVFSSASSSAPAFLVFQLNEDMFLLLQGASRIRGVRFHPVPRGREHQDFDAPAQIASQRIRFFVETRADLIRSDDNELITIDRPNPGNNEE